MMARRFSGRWPRQFVSAATLPLTALLGALLGAGAIVLIVYVVGHFDFTAVFGGTLPWYTTRAAGVTAYMLLSATTLLGLSISTRFLDRMMSRATAFLLHEWLSWLAMAALVLHIVSLLVDSFMPFSVTEVFIPFTSSYQRISTGLGVISLYLLVAITGSFYVRSRIGQRTWRTLHFASFGLYILATVHGIFSGATQDIAWMQWVYVVSASATGFLLASRILEGRRNRTARRATPPNPPLAGRVRS